LVAIPKGNGFDFVKHDPDLAPITSLVELDHKIRGDRSGLANAGDDSSALVRIGDSHVALVALRTDIAGI